VTALFFYNGYPCGRVRRSIEIGIPDESNLGQQSNSSLKTTSPNSAPTALSRISVPSDGPDMTIVILKTDAKRYQCFVLARNAEQPRGQVLDWGDYWDPTPDQSLQEFYKKFGDRYPKDEVKRNLLNLGFSLFDKAPENVKSTLLKLYRKGQPPRTVLVFSDEPYFPWELVIPHWPDRNTFSENSPLGATKAVARWTLDAHETFRSPARSVAVGKAVFWAPRYTDNPLTSSADEQGFLTKSLQGIAIHPATFDGLCNMLASSEATVLHFICHGSSDPKQPGMQTILAEPQQIERASMDQPLEGEASSTTYYQPFITPGEIAQCNGVKQFCAKRPLVFLNACQIGGTIQTMTSAGGFAPTFLQLNAGAVIAPLWSVFDTTAEVVAEMFYRAVQQSPHEAFAETVRKIRAKAFDEDPPEDLATYAAYCFYGDPLAAPANMPPQ
jgi:CHAT domain